MVEEKTHTCASGEEGTKDWGVPGAVLQQGFSLSTIRGQFLWCQTLSLWLENNFVI